MQLDTTEGEYTTAIAPVIDQYATQFEYSPDVEEGGHATGGLTDYASVAIRFDTLALCSRTAAPRSTPTTTSTRSRSATAPARPARPTRSAACPTSTATA
jgi:hypothetical protein